jgi:hypothetical protein
MDSVVFAGRESKKESKRKRLCRWISNSFSRKAISYIDPVAHTRSEEDREQPRPHSIALGYHGISSCKPVIRDNEKLENDHWIRGHYPTTQLSHPIVQYSPTERPPWDCCSTFTPSAYTNYDLRSEAQSPDYDAPRVQGRPRLRNKSAKNKNLPGPLRAQPVALTQHSLQLNERRHSSSSQRLIDQIPEPSQQMAWRWSNTYQGPKRSGLRLQQGYREHRVNLEQNALPLQNGFDGSRHSRSRLSREEPQKPRGYQATRGHGWHVRPGVVPLSNDSNRVLVHSKSRGFKVVRNLLSIEGLRSMVREQPRNVASLERMADDDRHACQELSS